MHDPLEQMAEVTRVRFEREYARIAALVEEEVTLRKQLAQIKAQIGAGHVTLQGPDMTIQAMSAGLLWQSWSTRHRARLEQELAGVLARKAVVLAEVRIAFGRKDAVDRMQTQEARDRAAARTKAQFNRLMGL